MEEKTIMAHLSRCPLLCRYCLNKMLEELKRDGVKVNYDGIKELYAKEIESWRF